MMKMEIVDVVCICTIYLSFICFCDEDISFNNVLHVLLVRCMGEDLPS